MGHEEFGIKNDGPGQLEDKSNLVLLDRVQWGPQSREMYTCNFQIHLLRSLPRVLEPNSA